ncbi:LysR family transcriptional regulator [Pusillimonas sp. DMV24BSW_D]|uniref:LysR family transcriptional regulator n=1 Tax=Neopusillimonas aestuarii TaxID=2716226 RepID=UPI00140975A5|nr:LysR family transcriptional regulator [Pusillimonas sp. DMV24BSW_D]QIM49413.1 LysR family transcriptional regulator [Pusillimonas sp. DMV24BSW_D]
MNITLRQLRAFVAVAEHQQFTRAAQQIHITQAALSMLVRDLEQEVGLRLFDRHTRMVKLTDAGRELLGMAKRILSEVETTIEHSRDFTTYQRGRVTVASGTVLAAVLLSPFMRLFRDQYPGIKLQLRDMAEQDLQRRLLEDDIDMGVGTRREAHDEIDSTPLFSDTYIAVLPPKHPLGTRNSISWKQLCNEPFIALSRSSPLRREIDQHLTRLGLSLKEMHEVSFHTTVLAMVRNGLGVSVLPANSQEVPEAQGLQFRKLSTHKLKRETALFQLRHRSLSPAAQLFKDALLNYVKKAKMPARTTP